MPDPSAYSEHFLLAADEMHLVDASWLFRGGLVALDELLIFAPPTARFAMLTYDADDRAYGAEYFDRSAAAAEAAAETLTGLPGFLVAIVDLETGRCMRLAVNVHVL
jgi:hypothetical protein